MRAWGGFMDKVNAEAWVGRTDIGAGRISAEAAAMIHATLGTSTHAAPVDGEDLPPLWHWCAFPPVVPTSRLSSDGHPERGGFLPPLPLERRMWAGGELTFHRPLHVGEAIERQSSIRAVTEKDGAAGPMAFVTVDHRILGEDGLAVEERHDIVYLPMPDRFRAPRAIPAPTGPRAIDEQVQITTPLLFRYSAITFNAHRIHYDLTYATEVERYPGLVVHGPLQATWLIDAATRHRGTPPSRFSYRGVHPVFHTDSVSLVGEATGPDELALCTVVEAGHRGMQATANWQGDAE
jgi:3-methylfumaryl-CoA hydratase